MYVLMLDGSQWALIYPNENQLASHLIISDLRIELVLTKMRTKSLKINYFIFIKKLMTKVNFHCSKVKSLINEHVSIINIFKIFFSFHNQIEQILCH